ncbi:MAG: hypothetical protein FD168_1984 [Desulfobulbaceae bacterium]|nr:MAG: hypothetical protein FD168_1984 [Desulfobulbaceae bacterium]
MVWVVWVNIALVGVAQIMGSCGPYLSASYGSAAILMFAEKRAATRDAEKNVVIAVKLTVDALFVIIGVLLPPYIY